MGIKQSKRSNIVAWWDLGRGTLQDFGNSNHDLADNNDAHFGLINSRNGIKLDGTNQYLSSSDHADFSFGDGSDDSAFSVSAWIDMSDATGFPVISKGIYNTSGEWRMLVSAADDKIYFQTFDESVADCYIGRVYNTAIASYEGQSIHVIGTYDGSEASSGFKIYINGVRVDDADAELNAGSYVAMEALAADVHIGRDDSTYGEGSFAESIVWNVELSASESAQLYEESVDYISKISTPIRHKIPEKIGSTSRGIHDKHDFIFSGETVKSQVAGGTDLTQTAGTLVTRKDILGNIGLFNNTNYLAGNSSAAYYNISGIVTISCWFKTSANTINGLVEFTDGIGERYGLLTDTGSKIRFESVGVFYRENTGSILFSDGKWHHFIAGHDGSNAFTYFDGVSKGVSDSGGIGTTTANRLFIGELVPGGFTLDGELARPRIWNRGLSAAEAKDNFNEGANLPILYDNFEQANVSTQTSISSGFLENTRWTVASGTFKISDEADTGKKRIECVGNGTITTDVFLGDYLGNGYLKILSGNLSGDESGTVDDGSSTAYASGVLTITMTAGQVINEIMITVGASV